MAIAVAYPTSEADPFTANFVRDPYPTHDRLRSAGPVVRLTKYDVWSCARYDEVRAILLDPMTYCSGAGVGIKNLKRETNWRKPSLLLENDPPEQTRLRRILLRLLTPAAIRELRKTFEPEAVRLVDDILARSEFDAVTHLAEPFPMRVFPDAVGLLPEDRHNLISYGRMNFDSMGPENDIYADTMANVDEVSAWIDAQCVREKLRPDGLGAQVYAAVDSGEVTTDEAALLVRSFLSAGIDTTVNALASAVYCMASNPGQWRILNDDLTLVAPAFEEVLRYESPFQHFFRTASCDVRIADVDICAGDKVLLLVASANRDPRRWVHPEEFDIRRRPVGHVGFGASAHSCLGQMIARLEASVLLTELARRVETIELTGEPHWRPSNTLRGLARLPVAVTPRARAAEAR